MVCNECGHKTDVTVEEYLQEWTPEFCGHCGAPNLVDHTKEILLLITTKLDLLDHQLKGNI